MGKNEGNTMLLAMASAVAVAVLGFGISNAQSYERCSQVLQPCEFGTQLQCCAALKTLYVKYMNCFCFYSLTFSNDMLHMCSIPSQISCSPTGTASATTLPAPSPAAKKEKGRFNNNNSSLENNNGGQRPSASMALALVCTYSALSIVGGVVLV